jgi:hypothetical protein
MTRRTSIAEDVLAVVADDNDYDAESRSEEQQLLLQQADGETTWTAPKGFIWIQVGMCPSGCDIYQLATF